MRILHLVDRLTDRGGAYQHLLALLSALAPAHEQLLAAGRDEGTVRVPCALALVPGLAEKGPAPLALDALVDAFAPDVVHVHNVMNPTALRWAGAHGRSVLTVQDHRYFCPTRGKWTTAGEACREVMRPALCAGCFQDEGYFRSIYALTAERLEAVRRLPLIVLSRYVKAELVAAGLEEGRVCVIPPFVHGLDAEAEPDGPPCVLFVGRLVEAKGVREAVAAWRESRLDLPLVMAGTGPLRESLSEAGIDVLGWVSHERLSRVYRRARALLLPPRWQEPFGIAGLEALQFGVPVVAWRSGGVEEWHPGPLVPWGDVGGLARALRGAVGGRASPPTGFAREPLMERLLGLYAQIAGSGGWDGASRSIG